MPPQSHDGRHSPATTSNRLRRGLAAPAFHAVLASVGFLLATWPFVRSQPDGMPATALYLFAVWAAFIGVLRLTSRANACDGGGSSDGA